MRSKQARKAQWYNKLEKLNVRAGKKDKILLVHVQRLREAHETVMRSYFHKKEKKKM